jgi:hypothetical protein
MSEELVSSWESSQGSLVARKMLIPPEPSRCTAHKAKECCIYIQARVIIKIILPYLRRNVPDGRKLLFLLVLIGKKYMELEGINGKNYLKIWATKCTSNLLSLVVSNKIHNTCSCADFIET